jgi:hypothetical protein
LRPVAGGRPFFGLALRLGDWLQAVQEVGGALGMGGGGEDGPLVVFEHGQ